MGFNTLSLQDTYGKGLQQHENNRLREAGIAESEARTAMAQTQFDEAARLKNTQRLVAFLGHIIKDPDNNFIPLSSALVNEGILEPGYISQQQERWQSGDPAARQEILTGAQTMRSQLMASIGQGPVGEGEKGPADVETYKFFTELSPQEQGVFMKLKRLMPGMKIVKVPRADGTEQAILWDETTGTGYDFSGKPVTATPGGAPGAPADPAATPPTAATPPGLGVSRPKEDEAAAVAKAQADVDHATGAPQRVDMAKAELGKALNAMSAIQRAEPLVSNWSVGPGSKLAVGMGTDADDLASSIDTIVGILGFGALQEMRNNSPTGGALGQVAVRELEMLQSLVASLKTGQSKDQFKSNLSAVKSQFERWAMSYGKAIAKEGTEEQFQEYWDMVPVGMKVYSPDGKVRIKE